MNRHLNNWLDEVEGKPKNTSNNAIKKELERQGYKVTKANQSKQKI